MKFLLTGGGTGGHVYPALSVYEALLSRGQVQVAWVGRANSLEQRITTRQGLPFHAVAAGAVRGANPVRLLRSLGALCLGFMQARRLLIQFQPDAVLATGGYVSVPLVLAARLHRQSVPVLLYLPDMEPGWAVRFLAWWAQRVAVSFDAVARYFPRQKVLVSGYPVRRALWQHDKPAARAALGLEEARPTLLLLGGSRGAHSLNAALRSALASLLQTAQVVHITGEEEYPVCADLRQGLAEGIRAHYHPFAYLDEQMPTAFLAADLVVARAGAATLGEFPAAGLPAVLVPYPYAGRHQQRNAAYLAERGAAVVLEDADLPARFQEVVAGLLGDAQRLQAMRAAAQACACPAAAETLAAALVTLGTNAKG